MNRKATAAQIEMARRVLAHERAAGSARTAAGRVYDKLHAELAPLIGAGGVHLLFKRGPPSAR